MKTQGELLHFYQGELKRSKNWRTSKTTNYDKAWKRYIDLYQGRYLDGDPSTDALVVNMVFATINVMAPAVAINNPRFVVNARNPESGFTAIITEEVLNWLWRAYDYQREFRLSVLDWLLAGHGWVKVGYKWTKEAEVKPADGDTTTADEVDAGPDEGIDDREDKEGNVESEMNQWNDDRPFIERISIFDMYVDPDARHPKEMRWIAQRTWRPVQDVQVDSRYASGARKKVSGSSWSRWDNEDGDARDSSEKPNPGAIRFCEVIEFYDLKRYKVCTFCPTSDEQDEPVFLIKPTKMPYAFGHPFVMLRNYEIPDHFYPIGDVAQIESLQLELNETRTQMFNYRKKFRRAWLYARDRFDTDGIEAMESDRDNIMIPVQGDNDPESAMRPVPAIITPAEFFDQSAMISNDLDRVSGVSDYQRGSPNQQVRRTATEAAMIQDAANARAQDRLAKIELVLSEIAERVVGLMQQYTTGDQVARIVTMPVKGWVNFDKDRIAGEFDFEVQGGSTEPRNETFRRQSALQIVDVSQPFMQAGVVNMPALYQELLQKGFGIKDASRFVEQPPPPPPPEGADQSLQQLGGPPPGEPPPQGPPQMPPGPGASEAGAALGMPPQGMPPGGMPPMPPGMPPGMEGQIPPELMALLMQQQQGPPPEEMMAGAPPMQ
jgi:hypothetical protein